ncbi:PfkB family carbohydrate kinase [Microbacterium sp. ASV49]|uniref:PfkB family carbohydrate kinase n=1 Tax=Microbacterium candidum TaxID=3041922 RepID=A0ABT7MWA1_9MICO|nr:PfkB family carbohydrate kinase [Microbacterium sp. ASV49]MDL9978731.1 PfkB family carbohydrate kinase [Microbacterium sp. ASV49]
MRKVAIAGHICVDLSPGLGGPAVVEPGGLVDVGPLSIGMGGCVANTAQAMTRLGHPVVVYATVGDDDLGSVVRRELADSDLIDAHLRVVPLATSYSLVIEQPGVDRVFWHHLGANAAVSGSEIVLDNLDLLHVGYPSLLPPLIADGGTALSALLGTAKAAAVTTSVDLAVVDRASDAGAVDWRALLRSVAPGIDILTPSLDDLTSAYGLPRANDLDLAEQLADELISWGVGVVAISCGSLGVALRTSGAERLRDAGRALAPLADQWADAALRGPITPMASLRTTNGAGDASTAGLLYAVSMGAGPAAALQAAASSSAAHISAIPAAETVFDADAHRPWVLETNRPPARFYRGGAKIAAFRGLPDAPEYTPEDWVGSTVAVRGQEEHGRAILVNGRSVDEAVRSAPREWLGHAHVERFGADPKLLVKLLDAGQRLPAHVHPDAEFAQRAVDAAHGKAEAWHILEGGSVHLGFTEDVDRERLGELVASQDTSTLLGMMHAVDVAAGDRVFVPPRLAHAIGEGILLVEVQEPEDLSILLEWQGFAIDGERDGHLGVGFDRALDAVDRSALAATELELLVRRAGDAATGLPSGADAYFRLEAQDVHGKVELGEGFAVLVVTAGAVTLASFGNADLALRSGDTVLVPAGVRRPSLHGAGEVLVARPPK